MDYYFKLPTKELQHLIHNYEYVNQSETLEVEYIDKHIPHGYAYLVFINNGYLAINDSIEIILPENSIGIPNSRALTLKATNNFNSFSIVCKASRLSKLLNLNFSEFNTESCNCNNIPQIAQLANHLKKRTSFEGKIRATERFLLELGFNNYQEDEIDLLYDKILTSRGSGSIQELIQTFSKSSRFFRLYFQQRTGIKAKTLVRLARIKHIWDCFNDSCSINFLDMVFAGGYHDQSHFIKDFKEITGETPAQFFQRDLSLVKAFSNYYR